MDGGRVKLSTNSPPKKRIEIHPHAGPQDEFVNCGADICVYGGAAGGGKSWGLLASMARWSWVDGFGSVIFRRTCPQITNEGGLWDESMKFYPKLKGDPKAGTLEWSFPTKGDSGSSNISFRHLQYETDKLSWQGAAVAGIGFDELTHFSEGQFWYFLSRNRSTCGVQPYIRATTNPVPADDPLAGWVNRLVSWWINQETGFAIPERSGVMRWMVRIDNQVRWADSKQELMDLYGDKSLPDDHEDQPCQPKSFTFISAKLSDNPTLTKTDTGYKANLLALPEYERQQLLEGNWNARLQAGTFYRIGVMSREGMIVDVLPVGLRYCRAWDLAHTEGAGDWTVGAKIGTDGNGLYYISDMIRGQWEVNGRDERIKLAAEMDDSGEDRTVVRIPEDPSAGKSEAARIVKLLDGHIVKPKHPKGKKEIRQSSFASQFNAGNVKMLRAHWNQGLLQRLDAFPTKGVNDDEGDALADAHDELAKGRIMALVGNSNPLGEESEPDPSTFTSLVGDDYLRDEWARIVRDEQVCPHWKESLTNFRHEMGERPSENHKICLRDKLDFYSPTNCYWGTGDEAETPTPKLKRKIALVAN